MSTNTEVPTPHTAIKGKTPLQILENNAEGLRNILVVRNGLLRDVHGLSKKLAGAELDLTLAEYTHLMAKTVQGANEAARKAHLHSLTKEQHVAVRAAQAELDAKRLELAISVNVWDYHRYVLRTAEALIGTSGVATQ